jgi:putative salt-induced outer membrane protein YdiY
MWIHVMVMMMIGVLCGVVQAAQQQVTVTLSNGDVLHGELVSESDTHLVIEHPVLGQLKLAREGAGVAYKQEVIDTSVGSKEEPATTKSEQASPATPVVGEAPAVEEKPAPSPWTGSISLAATASDNSRSSYDMRLGASLNRKRELDHFDLTATWYWSQQDNVTTDNDFLMRASQEWYIEKSRWLYFAQGTWQYDQFEAWGHRVSPYAGVGYKLFDTDDLELNLKAGAGVTAEYENRDIDPQLLFEMNTSWKITDRQSLTGYLSIAPGFNDWSNYLLTLSADWKLKLSDDSGWSLKVGVRNIYFSNATAGATPNDFKGYAGLEYGF